MLELKTVFPEILSLDETLRKIENPAVAMLVANHKAILNNAELSFDLTHDKFLEAIKRFDLFSHLPAQEILGNELNQKKFLDEAKAEFIELMNKN